MLRPLLLTALAVTGVVSAAENSRRWSVIETARDTGHLLAPVAAPASAVTDAPSIICDPAQRFQEIVGFGGALTESAAWTLAQLPAERRDEVLRHYFDPREGIGYTLARTHINSCDFSLGSWSLDDTPGDTELRDFSLAPMRRWLLPLIHDARRVAGGERLRLLASPWSPPAWMKTNGAMADGGELRADCRDAWARFFVRFLETMQREEQIPVWALTVQNEPEAKQVWESCIYTPEAERDFVRDHLGPTLARSGFAGVKLLVHDHNRDILEAHAQATFGDPAAAQYVWGTALHWYVSDDFAASTRVHDAFPDKAILFTEGCLEGGMQPGRWDRGERYATNIIGDLRNWVCGWIDWNIALDLTGGPNHVGNLCDAPVLVDTAAGTVRYQNSFYYIAHFSRYVQPGARRIASSGGPADLQSIAFANPDGSLALIVLNATDSARDFALTVGTETLACQIPGHAIQTYLGAKP
ncbi:MAG TPA: glycoside hydrolase family 30 protein [Opitutaceae bacterium]|nr:glycoside hydrolase family 30 protein [Opitutaceae bacterium]